MDEIYRLIVPGGIDTYWSTEEKALEYASKICDILIDDPDNDFNNETKDHILFELRDVGLTGDGWDNTWTLDSLPLDEEIL